MTDQTETRRAQIRALAEACTLHGEFKLRSGEIATTYFDKYQFEARPELLAPLADWMTVLLPENTEILAGLELGGVPLATAIALKTNIPAVFVRKEAKTYGTCRAVEGPAVAGKRAAIIEDVVTTGGAIVDAVAKLREAGAVVDTVVCAIWRGSDLAVLRAARLELRWVLERSDLEKAMR